MSTANAKHAENRRKLTRAEKKEIAALIRAAKGDGKAHTAQQTIPYLAMYPDGICKVTEKKYSKSIAYDDINYQLAQADDKTAIFENWCDFLNYFDATVSVQLSFVNRGTRSGGAKEVVAIPAQNDAFNSIRTEYADMLKHQLAKGNNGFVKSKYITFSVEADNLNAAKARLARIETDILNNFKVLGAAARPMTGYKRLEALHSVFHPEGEPFRFSWDWLTPSGLTTKDFIAPSSFRFGEGRYFRMGRKIGAVSFLEILAPELNDRMLADILDLETGIVVNLHIKSIDQTEAIKTIKRKITDLDKMKIEEQKKAVRSGYDMDIIPSDLAMFGGEAKNLLQDLQSRNERMFLLTFLVVNMADTKRKLENDIFAAAGIAQKYNCALTRLDYQQEAGLMSSVPLGENLIPIQRGLTTSSTAIFIPFITQELFQKGAALYYGLNALSSNMILCDRKRLKNPNGLILGTPGSGKSFAAKREITNAFLITDDDIIICDPEAEYYPLVRRLHGQVIRISPTSTQYYDAAAIAEPIAPTTAARYRGGRSAGHKYDGEVPGQGKVQGINRARTGGYYDEALMPTTRNKRDVWHINTVPYKGGHFAAFPPKLAKTCILAGCPKGGVVLDPFFGSGTTGLAAKSLDRHYIGIELNYDYCTLARARIGGETN